MPRVPVRAVPRSRPTSSPTLGRLARAVALGMAAIATTSACSALETNVQDAAIAEKDTARQNFEAAEAAFAAARWQEAVKYFELVKNKFPYSKYAVLAELRLADAHFAREKWLEAASGYRLFVRFHPRHEQVAWAAYRVALSHSRAVENNVAWLPFIEAREKDQSAAVDTIKACDEFLVRFPKDEHADEVRGLRKEARGRLAEVDVYAAGFYEKRGKWQGAAWRYERVGVEFADSPQAPRALWRAGQIAAEHLDDPAGARTAWRRLLEEHAEAPEAALARAALEKLPAPSAPSAPSASPASPPTASTPAAAPDDGSSPPSGPADPSDAPASPSADEDVDGADAPKP